MTDDDAVLACDGGVGFALFAQRGSALACVVERSGASGGVKAVRERYFGTGNVWRAIAKVIDRTLLTGEQVAVSAKASSVARARFVEHARAVDAVCTKVVALPGRFEFRAARVRVALFRLVTFATKLALLAHRWATRDVLRAIGWRWWVIGKGRHEAGLEAGAEQDHADPS
jgi:hypothetical protein